MSETNFAAIGQLVTEAKNLLDSIKGGAIRTMQSGFDTFMSGANTEWASKKKQVDDEALAALKRVDTDTVMSAIGFTAQNYNGDFRDTQSIATAKGDTNVWPVRFGIGKGRNDAVKAEVIEVLTGHPDSRSADAQELLDFIGIGKATKYFSSNFNILKITILDPEPFKQSGYDFYIPDQHVKLAPSTTYMHYVKIVGTATMNYAEGKSGEWFRHISHFQSASPGAYTHIDLIMNHVSKGDVLYMALPTVCVGHFPKTKQHGLLYSPKTELIRRINGLK